MAGPAAVADLAQEQAPDPPLQGRGPAGQALQDRADVRHGRGGLVRVEDEGEPAQRGVPQVMGTEPQRREQGAKLRHVEGFRVQEVGPGEERLPVGGQDLPAAPGAEPVPKRQILAFEQLAQRHLAPAGFGLQGREPGGVDRDRAAAADVAGEKPGGFRDPQSATAEHEHPDLIGVGLDLHRVLSPDFGADCGDVGGREQRGAHHRPLPGFGGLAGLEARPAKVGVAGGETAELGNPPGAICLAVAVASGAGGEAGDRPEPIRVPAGRVFRADQLQEGRQGRQIPLEAGHRERPVLPEQPEEPAPRGLESRDETGGREPVERAPCIGPGAAGRRTRHRGQCRTQVGEVRGVARPDPSIRGCRPGSGVARRRRIDNPGALAGPEGRPCGRRQAGHDDLAGRRRANGVGNGERRTVFEHRDGGLAKDGGPGAGPVRSERVPDNLERFRGGRDRRDRHDPRGLPPPEERQRDHVGPDPHPLDTILAHGTRCRAGGEGEVDPGHVLQIGCPREGQGPGPQGVEEHRPGLGPQEAPAQDRRRQDHRRKPGRWGATQQRPVERGVQREGGLGPLRPGLRPKRLAQGAGLDQLATRNGAAEAGGFPDEFGVESVLGGEGLGPDKGGGGPASQFRHHGCQGARVRAFRAERAETFGDPGADAAMVVRCQDSSRWGHGISIWGMQARGAQMASSAAASASPS